jgi:hypothetical protein
VRQVLLALNTLSAQSFPIEIAGRALFSALASYPAALKLTSSLKIDSTPSGRGLGAVIYAIKGKIT